MVNNTVTAVYKFGSVKYDLYARTHIIGILNVTPDSFSDGGLFYDVEKAVKRGMEMVEQGADFIDVGGESTRPGSESISVEEELRRVIPVIERLAKTTNVPISIDSYKSSVVERALTAGAVIVNDISGLHFDTRLAEITAKNSASIILMHIKGTPRTMQQNPVYGNVVEEISSYLEEGVSCARKAGVVQIIVDPGIGFGKKLEHNIEIFQKLQEFHRFGYPVLIGPSRKSFIGTILDLPIDQRLEGTAAAVAVAIMNGANIVRVHDVREIKRVAQSVDAIVKDKTK